MVPATSVSGNGKFFFLVHEAWDFGGVSTYAELCSAAVAEYLPGLAHGIDWEAKTFRLPVVPRVSGGKLAWETLDGPRKGDASGTYLAHALLSAGFRGNAHYEPFLGNQERLCFDGAEDVFTAWCRDVAHALPAEEVLSFLCGDYSGLRAIPEFIPAAEAALIRLFGDGGIPVFRDEMSGKYARKNAEWQRGCRGMAPQKDPDDIGTLTRMGTLSTEEVARAIAGHSATRPWFVCQTAWGPKAGVVPRAQTIGILSREGHFLSR